MRSKNAAKNVLSSLILQFVTIICGFIVPKLIIETFGSETNGLLNSITQFLAYITLLESGFGPVVKSVLYKPLARKDNETIRKILKSAERFFRIIAMIFVGYIIVLCFIFPLIVGSQFDTWYTVSLLLIMAVGTFTEYFFGMAYQLCLQAGQKSYVPSIIQIVTTIINTVAVVVLIKFGFGIQVVKIATAVIFIVRPILYGLYVNKKMGISLKGVGSSYVIKQKWDGLAQHVAAVIHSNTDVMVLTLFSSLKEVSVYAIYSMVVKGIKSVVQALSNGIDAVFGDMMAKGEHMALNKKFSAYELFYHTASTIIFICAMILITPFISVYTSGITDADYVRTVFGVLIVISEMIWAVRLPYSSTTLAAGHFKETRKGAWVEAAVNIVISVILVFQLGIIGVAIGTIVAMAIRTVEFMYHTSKHILKRSLFKTFSWLVVITVESVIGFMVCRLFISSEMGSYVEWIKNAAVVFVIVAVEVITINMLCYRKDLPTVKGVIKKIIKKK